MSGLRDQIDREAQKRTRQKEELEQIRQEIQHLSKEVEDLDQTITQVNEKVEGVKASGTEVAELKGVMGAMMEKVNDATHTARRVAATFDAKEQALWKIEKTGEAVDEMKTKIRNQTSRLLATQIVGGTLTLVIWTLILWIGGVLTF